MATWKPGWVWLENAGEKAVGAAALSAGALLSGKLLLADVPWYAVASAAALGALASLLNSLGTTLVGPGKQNGTASYLRNVVARDTTSGP